MLFIFFQGSTVYSNYGYKSNEELILGYGFMIEDNPADFFHVSLGLHAQTERTCKCSSTVVMRGDKILQEQSRQAVMNESPSSHLSLSG